MEFKCPKCESINVLVRHVHGSAELGINERLAFRCGRCDYYWTRPTADTPSEEAGKDD